MTDVELVIEKAVHEGHTLARLGRRVVFVQGALPGERVRARFVKVQRRFSFARAVEILEPSPHRVPPGCDAFGACGGCSFLNLDYAEQLKIKRELVIDALRRIPGAAERVEPVAGCDPPFWFRNKMVYAFGLHDGAPTLGLHRRGDYAGVVPTPACRLQSPESSEILRRTLEFARAHGLSAYDERSRAGRLRALMVREGKRTGERMVNLVATELVPELHGLEEVLGDLCGEFIASSSPAGQCVARTDRSEVWKGRGLLRERLGPFEFELAPETFFQTNTLQAERLFETLADWARALRPQWVVDLYAGVGPIACFLSGAAQHVIAVEMDRASVQAAEANMRRNRLSNVEVRCGAAEGDALAALPGRPDIVVVDPPRAGLLPKARARLLALGAPHLAYVSCNPATLARDLEELLAAGYELTAVRPFDMFPHTYHIETVTFLRRPA